METVHRQAGGDEEDGRPAKALEVFVNYRHEDTDAAALLLYDRLAARFGPQNVFLDVKTLELGAKWMNEIKGRGADSSVFLALIGRNWLRSLKERRRGPGEEAEDYVALELELALGRWPGRVVPVLVGGAVLPAATELPRPLRALAACQSTELRHGSFDEDIARLMADLETLPASNDEPTTRDEGDDTVQSESAPAPAGERLLGPTVLRGDEQVAVLGPDDAHFTTVLCCMVEEGTLVPVLGSRVRGALPDSEQLAAHLAAKFKLGSQSLDLAEVAQHVAVAEGPSFLHRAVREALDLESEPGEVERFLARFPARLAELGREPQHQMIVSTNYDTTLERAFDERGEPYDLAVFTAGGAHPGKFVHVPWNGEPCVVTEPSKYRDFPIDPYDELERTVIVKILGAAEGGEGAHRWDRSYVLTEDQYIDYLVTDQVGSLVPLQILNKLTSSHCLFLGYHMRDWSLRVFLKRIWQGRPLDDRSWAVEHEPDALEKDFWRSLHVELLAAAPGEYANELDARIRAWNLSGA